MGEGPSRSKNSAARSATHGRGDGAERLAPLHVGVEPARQVRVAGVGEDAAVAEGTRPELAAALEPAHDGAARERLRGDP
jgi:hypothetical protein